MTATTRPDQAELDQLEQLIGSAGPLRVDLQPDEVSAGLAQIVLLVLRLLHELLERQAIRRVEEGQLSSGQVEAMGQTLQQARRRLDELYDFLVADGRGQDDPETERSKR